MSTRKFRKITVIGVGLLGGSVALAAKAADEDVQVVGVGRRRSSLEAALAAGAIDEATLDTAEGVAGAELVVLATPLGAYETHLRAIQPALKAGTIVTDIGSTKSLAVRLAEGILGRGGSFVGSHPMAGGERTGVQFARADLFVNATCVVTPTASTPERLTKRIEKFWQDLGGITTRLSPARHDQAVARVSHLPHLLAALIVQSQTPGSLDLAGGGFMDTTRVASGSPAMWREIILTNRRAVLAAIDKVDEGLTGLRDLVELGDGPGIERLLARARKRRDALVAQRLARGE